MKDGADKSAETSEYKPSYHALNPADYEGTSAMMRQYYIPLINEAIYNNPTEARIDKGWVSSFIETEASFDPEVTPEDVAFLRRVLPSVRLREDRRESEEGLIPDKSQKQYDKLVDQGVSTPFAAGIAIGAFDLPVPKAPKPQRVSHYYPSKVPDPHEYLTGKTEVSEFGLKTIAEIHEDTLWKQAARNVAKLVEQGERNPSRRVEDPDAAISIEYRRLKAIDDRRRPA